MEIKREINTACLPCEIRQCRRLDFFSPIVPLLLSTGLSGSSNRTSRTIVNVVLIVPIMLRQAKRNLSQSLSDLVRSTFTRSLDSATGATAKKVAVGLVTTLSVCDFYLSFLFKVGPKCTSAQTLGDCRTMRIPLNLLSCFSQ